MAFSVWFDRIIQRRTEAASAQQLALSTQSDTLHEVLADALRLAGADGNTSLSNIIDEADRTQSTRIRFAVEKLESLFNYYQRELTEKGDAWFSQLSSNTGERYWNNVTLNNMFESEKWQKYVDAPTDTQYALLRRIRDELRSKNSRRLSSTAGIENPEWEAMPSADQLKLLFDSLLKRMEAVDAVAKKKKAIGRDLKLIEAILKGLNEIKLFMARCIQQIRVIAPIPSVYDSVALKQEILGYKDLSTSLGKQEMEKRIESDMKRLVASDVVLDSYFTDFARYIDDRHTRCCLESMLKLASISLDRIGVFRRSARHDVLRLSDLPSRVERIHGLIGSIRSVHQTELQKIPASELNRDVLNSINAKDRYRLLSLMLSQMAVEIKQDSSVFFDSNKWRIQIASVADTFHKQCSTPQAEYLRFEQRCKDTIERVQTDSKQHIEAQVKLISAFDGPVNELVTLVQTKRSALLAELDLQREPAAVACSYAALKLPREVVITDGIGAGLKTIGSIVEYVNSV